MKDQVWVNCHHCKEGVVYRFDTFAQRKAWLSCEECEGEGGWWA